MSQRRPHDDGQTNGVEVESSSPEQTEEVGARLAEGLARGDVVTVSGELGTGKTTLVRGACRALGVEGPVTSRTSWTQSASWNGPRRGSTCFRPRASGCRWRTPASTDGASRLRNADPRLRHGHRPRDERARLGRGGARRARLPARHRARGPRRAPAPRRSPGLPGRGDRSRRGPGKLHRAADGVDHRPHARVRLGCRPRGSLDAGRTRGRRTGRGSGHRRTTPGGVRPRRRRGGRGPAGGAPRGGRQDIRRRRRRPVPGGDRTARGRGPAGRERAAPPTRPVPRRARGGLRRAGPGRADVPSYPGRGQASHVIDLRPLTLSDLGRIERIERTAYPTPWSRSMFAGEIAKGSSICLGAVDTDVEEQLVGYLIISRYADAWHIMNVAVDPEYRRRGVATQLLNRLFELTAAKAIRTATAGKTGATFRIRVGDETNLPFVPAEPPCSSGSARGVQVE